MHATATAMPSAATSQDDFTTEESCRALGISDKTFQRWREKAREQHHRTIEPVKKHWDDRPSYYRREDLEWLAAQHHKTLFAPSKPSRTQPGAAGAARIAPEDLQALVHSEVQRQLGAAMRAFEEQLIQRVAKERRQQTPNSGGSLPTRAGTGYASPTGYLDDVPDPNAERRLPPHLTTIPRMAKAHGLVERTVAGAKDSGRLRPILQGIWIERKEDGTGGYQLHMALDIIGMRSIHHLFHNERHPDFARNSELCLYCEYLEQQGIPLDEEHEMASLISDEELQAWVRTKFPGIVEAEEAAQARDRARVTHPLSPRDLISEPEG